MMTSKETKRKRAKYGGRSIEDLIKSGELPEGYHLQDWVDWEELDKLDDKDSKNE